MSRGLNKVTLIGHLGKEPELRYTPNGTAVCNFTIATSETFKADDGSYKDATEWHNIVVWRKLAETCANYLKKGSKIYCEGKLKTESYEKDGDRKYVTKIIVNSMLMLDNAPKGEVTTGAVPETEGFDDGMVATNGGSMPSGDDDLPF